MRRVRAVPVRPRALLRRLRRSPALHWSVAVVFGLVSLSTFTGRARELDRLEATFGSSRSVLVVSAAHRAGEVLDPTDVQVRRLPISMVPDRAMTRLDRPARVAVDLAAGEVLVRTRLRAASRSALAAMLTESEVALAIGLPDARLELRPGDRVDLVAPGPDGTSETVAVGARVLDAGGSSATVALRRSDAAAATDASLAGTLTVWLSGG